MSDKNLKGNILEATIQAFQKKGLKFTMDDLASLLGISKKTIYTVFPDKNSLVLEMVDYCFSSIKESEQKVLQDLSLDTVGKIRAILGVLPEGYRELDLRQLYQLKERYPEVYEKVKSSVEHIEKDGNLLYEVQELVDRFSTYACECCGSRLHGERFFMVYNVNEE